MWCSNDLNLFHKETALKISGLYNELEAGRNQDEKIRTGNYEKNKKELYTIFFYLFLEISSKNKEKETKNYHFVYFWSRISGYSIVKE